MMRSRIETAGRPRIGKLWMAAALLALAAVAALALTVTAQAQTGTATIKVDPVWLTYNQEHLRVTEGESASMQVTFGLKGKPGDRPEDRERYSAVITLQPPDAGTLAIEERDQTYSTLQGHTVNFYRVAGDTSVTLNLTFTAPQDDDADDESAAISLAWKKFASGWTGSSEIIGIKVKISITDDDEVPPTPAEPPATPKPPATPTYPLPTVKFSTELLEITEGKTVKYRVRVSPPAVPFTMNLRAARRGSAIQNSDGSVTYAGGADYDGISVSPTSLDFEARQAGEADQVVEVTVTAPQNDQVAFSGSGSLLVHSFQFNGEEQRHGLPVILHDDDSGALILDKSEIEMDEDCGGCGGCDTTIRYPLILMGPPKEKVVVTVESSNPEAVFVKHPKLVFHSKNWKKPKYVQVRSILDSNDVSETVTLTFLINGEAGKYIVNGKLFEGQAGTVKVKVNDVYNRTWGMNLLREIGMAAVLGTYRYQQHGDFMSFVVVPCGGNKSRVNVNWPAYPGAEGYVIRYGGYRMSASGHNGVPTKKWTSIRVDTNSARITNLDPKRIYIARVNPIINGREAHDAGSYMWSLRHSDWFKARNAKSKAAEEE